MRMIKIHDRCVDDRSAEKSRVSSYVINIIDDPAERASWSHLRRSQVSSWLSISGFPEYWPRRWATCGLIYWRTMLLKPLRVLITLHHRGISPARILPSDRTSVYPVLYSTTRSMSDSIKITEDLELLVLLTFFNTDPCKLRNFPGPKFLNEQYGRIHYSK